MNQLSDFLSSLTEEESLLLARLASVPGPMKSHISEPPTMRAETLRDLFTDQVEVSRGEMPLLKGDLAGLAKAARALMGKKGIRAFHGSPHDFDAFRMERIGTGEGAQAYGHGLYFSETPATATSYRQSLAGRADIKRLKVGGLEVGPHNRFDYSPKGNTNIENIRSSLTEDLLIDELGLVSQPHKAQERALAILDQKIKDYATEWPEGVIPAKRLRAQLARPGAVKLTMGETPGHTYEVRINASPDDLLDLDAPLSRQSEKIREGVASAFGDVRPAKLKDGRYAVTAVSGDGSGRIIYAINEASADDAMKAFGRYVEEGTGQSAYQEIAALRSFPEPNPDAASSALREAGIPGSKYYDQMSRGAGEGTRNYVIFDDQIIDILRKFGLIGAVGAGAALQQQPQQ